MNVTKIAGGKIFRMLKLLCWVEKGEVVSEGHAQSVKNQVTATLMIYILF